MIGRTISHYRIVEKLGEGGMGVVYIAEDTVLGRRVAIKTLTTRGGDQQHFRTRFLREARAVSALSHPHIAHIYDYGETEDDEPYIVMELIKGTTLGDLMAKEALTIPRAIEIIKQVAEALGEAHRQGIVHRDIKPSNVAINERGNVKVLDFGLAKQIDLSGANPRDPDQRTLLNTQTREGVIVGTPMYLSPEQALGVDVDARSDLFALGSLLYECIAGKPAFSGASPVEICAQIIREDPPPPSQLNSNVTREMDRIVLKALAKKPNQRYQSADEMIADLSAAEESLSRGSDRTVTRLISSTPGTQPTGAIATLSDIFKRPRLSVGYVAAGLLLLSLIGFGAWRLTRPRLHLPKPEAQRLYDRGVEAMREGAFFKASKLLHQAVQEDDQFALAHARLAECWTELDSSDKAQSELIRALALVPDPSVLPKVDGLKLQAVTRTVQREFAKAVEDYRAITSSVSGTEKAYALVDLGRAYEKDEKPDKAIETYQEAARLDSHYAASFLRLGVTHGRRQHYDDAYVAFDQAHKLFDLSNEVEGLTEVLLQRGILLGQQRRVDDARVQLQQALGKSTALENKDKQIKVLLNLSQTEINAGQPAQAEKYSSEALALAQAKGLESLTAAGLIDVGYAHLGRGNYAEAENYFNRAIQLAQLYKGKRNEARASLSLATLRIQQDRPDDVPELVRKALSYYEQGGHSTETSQAYLILGRAYDGKGDYDDAQKAFEQQLQLAQKVGNQSQMGFAHEGLASVAQHRQQYPEALFHYNEKYRISKSLNAKSGVGYSAASRGLLLGRLGRFPEAWTSLSEALQIAEAADNKALLAFVHVISAELKLSENKLREAISEGQKALNLSQTDFKSTAVRANSILGIIKSMTGQGAAGRKQCEEAVALARTLRDPLSASEALLALAEAALNAGDAQAAMNAANEAQQRFAGAKQYEFEWRAWIIQARANEEIGDKTRARESTQQASLLLTKLEAEWKSDAYKSYLTRPDVIERKKAVDAP